ncbi:MAG TPA: NAD(P)/FAD-dependent oxidoreductase, partial [Candidatus Methylacidiphilales bacterium]|nr:NAD(P)/FAD-dependent oxidoreductase [Candidatus Methylacidiphilales bacterium]
RARFDQLLLNHAEQSGAEVHEQSRISHVETRKDGVSIAWEQNGETHHADARWIIDATGRDAFVGKSFGIPRHDNGFPKRVAVYSHFKNIRRNEGEAAGMITIVRIEDGWFWIIPLDEEKTSVGLVQGLAGFKAKGRTPAEEFEATVQACTELRYRFKNAERMTDFHVTGDYCYRHRTLAGPRFLLAGDAGGFIDPIFSSGVMLAMRSARLAAKTILAQEAAVNVGAKTGGNVISEPLTAWQQRVYTRAVYHMMDTYANMIRMYYDNIAFEVFMNPAPWLQLPRAILAIVAGKTDLEFPLWWRMKVFYAICKVQKYLPVSPRINYADVMPSTGKSAKAKAREQAEVSA